MARLWSSGFELNSVTVGVEFTQFVGSASIVTTTVRSGTYSCGVSGLSSGTRSGMSYTFANPAGSGPYFFRAYLNIATLPSAANQIIQLQDLGNSFATAPVRIRLNSNGTLQLNDEDGDIGSPSSALETGAWYRVELEIDRTGSAGSHIVRARLNGTEFAGSTTRDISAAIAAFQWGGNLNTETQTVGEWFFDDLAINDSTGTSQTSYPGTGSIVLARPNGNGDNNDTSGTFADIDEITPDDASTIAVFDVDNDILDVACEGSSDLGISAGDAIKLIQVGARFANAASGTAAYKYRLKSASGGTLVEENGSHDSTSYVTNVTTSPKNYVLTSYVDPTTGVAWTPTGTNSLDNMQIGMQVTDATPDFDLSTLWALVEYSTVAEFDVTKSETISVSESLSSYSDNVFLRESYNLTLVSDVLEGESVSVAESIARVVESYINKNEAVSVTDTPSVVIVVSINVSDGIAVAESVSVNFSLAISVSESIGVAESISVTIAAPGGHPSVSDSVAVSESRTVVVPMNISVSESVSVAESIKMLVESYIQRTESVGVAEGSTVVLGVAINKSESVSVAESISLLAENYISKSESVAVNESINDQLNSFIDKSESVSVAEALTAFLPHVAINTSESIAVVEGISFSLIAFTFADSVTVSESVSVVIVLVTSDALPNLGEQDPSVVPLNATVDSITALH